MCNFIQTKRQSPINSNESIEDIKQNSQTADVLRCLKRIYGGMLLNMFPVQFMQKKKKLERKIARQVCQQLIMMKCIMMKCSIQMLTITILTFIFNLYLYCMLT